MADKDTVQVKIQPEVLDVDTSKVTKSIKDRFVDLQNEITKITNQMSKSTNIAPAVESSMKKVMSAFGSASTSMKKYTKATDESKASVQAYLTASERLSNAKKALQNFQDNARRSEEQYRTWMDDVKRRGGVGAELKAISKSASTSDEAIAERKKFLDFYNEASTYLHTVQQMRDEINQLSEDERILGDSIKNADAEIIDATAKLTMAENAMRNYNRVVEETSEAEDDSADGMSRLERTAAIVSTVFSGIGKTARGTFSDIRRVIKKVIQVINSLISKLSSLFKSLSKQNKGLEFNHKKLFKTFLQFGLGVRSLYFLIRRMRTEFIKGMKQMAASFPEVNAQVSALTQAFYQLKGSSVTMIQPILATVIPALVRLMNVLSKAMEMIAKFFAVLRGQKVIYKASAANVDYSESLDGVGDSADKANEELAEYDNLLVISQDKASGSGSGGGTDDNQYTFSEEPLDAVSDFAKKLKKAWESGDWEGVGTVIAEKLNSIISKVDRWITKKFTPAAKTWANRIARILNGFVGNFKWGKLGRTLAHGLNAVFGALETFLDKFDAGKLGRKLGTLIKNFFTTVDWKQIGRVFAKKWNSLMAIIKGIVTKKDFWESVGNAIGDFVTSWFETINLDSLATIIINLFNGVKKVIKTFLEKNPFKEIGQKLANSVSRIITEIDWADLMKTLSQLFTDFLKALEQVDWDKVGETIGEALGSIDWVGIFGRVANIILKAALGAIKGLLNTKNGRIFIALVTGLNALKVAFTLAKPLLKAAALNLIDTVWLQLRKLPKKIASLAPKVGDAIKNIFSTNITSGTGVAGIASSAVAGVAAGAAGTYIGLQASDLIQPGSKEQFIEAFNDTYSADSLGGNLKIWAKEWGNIFKNLWDDVMPSKEEWANAGKVISNWAKGVGTKLSGAWESAKEKVLNFRDKVVGAWEKMKTKVSGFAENIRSAVVTKWQNIKEKVGGFVDNIKTKVTTVWTNIKTWITTTAENIRKAVVDKFEKLRDGINGAFKSVKEFAEKIWESIWGAIKKVINDYILSGIEGFINLIVKGINALINALNGISFKVPEWMSIFVGKDAVGKTVGINITPLSEVSIPRLAQGAVIPPNKEFLALLGDQSRGTNIEAPLDTIKQALAEVMAEYGSMNQMPEKIQVVLPNGKVLAETVWKEERKYYKQTGRTSPAYS